MKEPTTTVSPLPPRSARLRPILLYCGKCLKRHNKGKALRRALKEGAAARTVAMAQKKARVVETRCLGLCPKSALVTASALTLARGEALLVRDAADVEAALARLLP